MSNSGGRDLQSKYEFNSAWADRIAFLIIVGLAVDIAAVFILKMKLLDGALTIVANALIAAGVWGELWFARRAKEAGDGIVAEAKARAANSMALAAGANSRSSMAQRQVAKANVRAAQLEKEAAEAKLALEQLRARIGPRRIDKKRLSEAMKPFAGQEFCGSVASDVADAWDLWKEINLSLTSAGWIAVSPPSPNVAAQIGPVAEVATAPHPGIMIMHPVPTLGDLAARAEALAAAIREETPAAAAPTITRLHHNALTIVIGPKPQ
jgi:hypothetical protein